MTDWMGDGDVAFPNLGIYIENLPKSFTIFGIEIAMYGVIIGIGIILAFLLISWQAKKQGQNPDDYYDLGLYILFFGILGARIYYVVFSWDYYKEHLSSIWNIRQGGLAIYGGIIAGFITLYVWCRIKKRSMKQMGDVAVLGVLVGQAVGRFGNFTNREAFGEYTQSLFAMRLPVNAVRPQDITETMREHITASTNYIQVHPTFLYESAYNVMLLFLILLVQKKKAFEGEVILWYLGGYGIGRFLIEGLRTDQLKLLGTNIAVSQWLGIVLFVLALLIDIFVRVRTRRSTRC